MLGQEHLLCHAVGVGAGDEVPQQLRLTGADPESAREELDTKVWAIPQNAPALAGTPETMILEPAATS